MIFLKESIKRFKLVKKTTLFYSLLSIITIVFLMSFFRKDSDNVPYIIYLTLFLFIFLSGIISSKKTSIIIYTLLLIYVSIEYTTERMTGFYFHEIPYEIISIIYDTNINEIKEGISLSTKEKQALFLVISYFILFLCIRKNHDNKKMAITQLSIFILFFIITDNTVARTINSIKNSKELIGNTLNIIKERQGFSWGSKSESNEKQTVVLFLGETHRGDYLSINGYKKDTTPNLLKENIISFNDAISQAAYTLQSTPMILSRKSVNDNGIFNEKSLISAFKEAGFETWYISYLSPTLIGDNEINLIANEADHYIQSDVKNETLDGILRNPSQKKLIVYKTIGSHFLYHNRYPDDYNIFTPSFTDADYSTPSVKDFKKLENSYLNSLLYSVDKNISDFINILKKEEGIVSLSFISDHGTSIYDDGKSLYGGNTKGNYNIALFFWFNDGYVDAYKNDIEVLKSNSHKKVTSEYFLDTMLHIGKINTEKRKNKSLFEKDIKEEKRLIKNKSIYDYDKDL
ncbi:MAG: phosphoethanolamine transferase [Providencia sp.]|uniref:phosphoethanolamine transferase n=1 Tax=Providencia sp. TaxID=589 RepID=UPI003F9BDCC1